MCKLFDRRGWEKNGKKRTWRILESEILERPLERTRGRLSAQLSENLCSSGHNPTRADTLSGNLHSSGPKAKVGVSFDPSKE